MADFTRYVNSSPQMGITMPGGQPYSQATPDRYYTPGITPPQPGRYTQQMDPTAPLKFGALTVADFLNTVSSSLQITDEKLLEDKLKAEMPNAYKYYMDNKGAIQFTGSVAGAFIPGTLAIKGLQAMSRSKALLQSTPLAGRLLINEKKMMQIEQQMQQRAQFLALQGERGGALKLDTEYAKLARDRLIYGADKGIKETLAAELAIYGTMNSSEDLFPEEWEWYDYAPFAALGGGISVGIEAAIARKATSRIMRQTASLAGHVMDPRQIIKDGITVRPGSEDVAATLLQLNSRDLDDQVAARGTQVTSTYATNVSSQKAANTAAIVGTTTKAGHVDKIAYRGSAIAPRTELSDSQKSNIRLALSENPLALLGVKEIAPYDATETTATTLAKRKQDYVEELTRDAEKIEKRANSGKVSTAEKNARLEEAKQLRLKATNIQNNYSPFVLRDGQWIPLEDHNVLFTDFSKNRKLFQAKVPFDLAGRKIENHFDPLTKQEFSFGIDYAFDYAGTKGKNLDSLHNASIYEQSAVFAGFDAIIDGLKGVRGDKTLKLPRVQVTGKDNWRRLDAIDEAVRRGHLDVSQVTFGKDIADLNGMRMQVIRKKFAEFKRYRERNTAASQGPLKVGSKPMSDAAIRYALNLPAAQMGEVSPIEQLFHALIAQGSDDLSKMSLQEFVDQAIKLKHFSDPDLEFAAKSAAELKTEDFNTLLRGQSFGPPEKIRKTGQYLEPVLAWRENLVANKLTLKGIENDLMIRRQQVKDTLMLPGYDPKIGKQINPADTMSGKIATTLQDHPASKVAAGVDQINEASLRGKGVLTTERFSGRDDPVFQAAHEINTITERVKNRHIIDTLNATGSHGKQYIHTFNILRNKENEAHLFQFGEWMRARQNGWFLKKKPVDNGDGTFSYELRTDSEFNQKRYRALFGEELKSGTVMPRITTDNIYQPLKVSSMAHEAATSMRELGERLLGDQNRIRKAMMLPLIEHKDWWAPPRNFQGKYVSYIVSQSDEGVIKRMITADTERELAAKKASQEVQDYVAEVGGQIIDQDKMAQRLGISGLHQARDRVFYELLDAGDPLVKGTKAARGSSVDPFVQSGRELLDEAVESMNSQWENIARDTVGLWFEPQIAYAGRANFVQHGLENERSVWKRYIDVLQGNRGLRTDTTIGPFWRFVEDHVDRALERYWDTTKGRGVTGVVSGAAQKALAAMGVRTPTERRFDKLKGELGDWLPYESTNEFLESNFNIRPPKSARQFAAEINGLTSTLTLRMFELGHPLLNMSGIIATSPSVISALRLRAGESLGEWQARTSAYGSVVPAKKPFSFFSSAKLMVNAAHFGFTPAGKAEVEFAKRFGYLDQQVAELNEIMTNPLRSEGDWKDWARRAVSVTSMLSDKSEVAARGWAHMAGVLLAKEHGITDQKLKHVFAHRFANELIGDYRSSNRPIVFQGAAGMPLGLFQTYVWNYYQRLYSYIENADYRAIAVQYAMQASVYGAQTMPGYSLFNSMWANVNEARGTPTDKIQEKYGHAAADLLLYGTLSNIPKLFANDGIALYTRGDTSPRVPAFINPTQAPPVQLATNFYKILEGVANQLQEGGQGLSAQQTSEVFSQFFTNRPMARMLELYSDYATDRNGNVISADIHNTASYIARVMGLRTLNEAKTMEVLRRQKVTEIDQYAQRARLREAVKAATRGGNLSPELLAGAFEDYAVSGGDPRYFTRFLKTTIMSATTPRGQLELEKMLKSNTKLQDAMRLMNAGVLVDDSDATE